MQENPKLILNRKSSGKLFSGPIVLGLILFFGVLFFPGFSFANMFIFDMDTLPASRRGVSPIEIIDTIPTQPLNDEPSPTDFRDSQQTQEPLTFAEEEPITVDEKKHSPLKATMLSVTFPGLGQAYNGRYWKMPIIYAGFGAIAYAVRFNNNQYQSFRRSYFARVDGNPNTVDEYPFYSTDQLQRATNFYRRNLEVSYILGAALYLLNVLDATVDAHLLDFDVGEDLSMNLQPFIIPDHLKRDRNQRSFAGLRFTFSF